jgi:uncharacterized protein involved in exopolysaccharide biosynthesis
MYTLELLKMLRRRWPTAVAGLVVTFGALLYVASVVPLQYKATGQMLLILPPEATGAATPSNP